MSTCSHTPQCPSAHASDLEAAHCTAWYPEQGWALLCNSLLCFEDTGALLPDGGIVPPHRPVGQHAAASA
ncbi:DUF5999 family protein [Streptomyces syringium]|uniref:DUF5999 family protein n=1 Tax=Streptomyces syringium TaxID=76729 RepID=UPI00341FC44F